MKFSLKNFFTIQGVQNLHFQSSSNRPEMYFPRYYFNNKFVFKGYW